MPTCQWNDYGKVTVPSGLVSAQLQGERVTIFIKPAHLAVRCSPKYQGAQEPDDDPTAKERTVNLPSMYWNQ